MTIVELQDKILAYEAQIKDIMAGEPSDEKVREADRVSGKLEECRNMLMAEARRVQDENMAIRAGASEPKAETFIDRVLGPKAAFEGIEPGWKATVATDPTQMSLPTPQRYSTDLPAPGGIPIGIIDTLPKGTTDGDEHYFQQPALDNKAGVWTLGNKKALSELTWPEQVARLETIAHYMPIAKLTARRYNALQSTVTGALRLGLELAKDAHVVRGSNQYGIVGLVNQTGILTYSQAQGEGIYEVAVNMKRRARIASALTPNCIAMPSTLISMLKTAKATDGHYLYEEVVRDGRIDGMMIVEDENLAVESGGTVTLGCLVYFSAGAEFDTADPDEVTIGLTGDQFVENTYTLLAEGTYALKVPFPKAFCYCASVATAPAEGSAA